MTKACRSDCCDDIILSPIRARNATESHFTVSFGSVGRGRFLRQGHARLSCRPLHSSLSVHEAHAHAMALACHSRAQESGNLWSRPCHGNHQHVIMGSSAPEDDTPSLPLIITSVNVDSPWCDKAQEANIRPKTRGSVPQVECSVDCSRSFSRITQASHVCWNNMEQPQIHY